MQPIWDKMIPAVLEKSLQDVREKLQRAKDTGEPPTRPEKADIEVFPIPLRIHREDVPEEKSVRFTTEILMGRELWISSMRHMLTNTVKVLYGHTWSILHAGFGLKFFTSDDPVVRLNFHSDSRYDFKGGWGSKGTEIFLPLTPRHLLYTKIGDWTTPRRGVILSETETQKFCQMIAAHAHRSIFASTQDCEVTKLRPRTVNAQMLDHEKALWRKWHAEQTAAEAELLSGPPRSKRSLRRELVPHSPHPGF
jgi:hypothetical protein